MTVQRWVRFRSGDTVGFGTLDGDAIAVHDGDMFAGATPTGASLLRSAVTLLTPVTPSKIPALWNNFNALAQKQNNAVPPEPLYFLKSPSSLLAAGEEIRRPGSFGGKVIFEGELGIVIGKRCRAIAVGDADEHIFGYTCVNDVTAVDILNRDASFAQWSRAKSFDGFGPVGPCIATGLDPAALVVRAMLNGQERQNYPVSDMIFGPREIVARLSEDMTLEPGDLICCGTSVGVAVMREPRNEVTIAIEGIGELTNTYVR